MRRLSGVLVALLLSGLAALGVAGWFVFELLGAGERLLRDGVCRTAYVSESYGFHVNRVGRFAEFSVVDADGRNRQVLVGYDGPRMLVGQPVRICSEPDDPDVFTFETGESFGRWFRGEVASFVLFVGGVVALSLGFQTYVSGGRGPTAYRPRH